MITTLLAAWLAFAAPAPGAVVRGQVRSAGQRTPIAAAKVFATGPDGAWVRETSTMLDGSFVFTDLPGRDFTLAIVTSGHARFEQQTVAAFWSRRRPRVIFVQPSEAGQYRTIVGSERERGNVVAMHLTPEEVRTLPGSQGDPLRALQNLPGVAKMPGGLGLLILRGAGANQSQVFFGEHPVPRAFHTPSLASVVPGTVLSDIKYIPGNFDASYGNATGGVVVMNGRRGRRDGIHGQLKLDLISAAAMVEGPLRRGSFIAAAQRGYLDLALRSMKPLIGDSFLLPRYYDYQIITDHPIGPGATLTTRFIGSGDTLSYPSSSSRDPAFALDSEFHRLDLAVRKRVERWEFLFAPALRFDRNSATSQFGLDRRSDVVGLLRAEIGVRPVKHVHLTVGADTQVDRYRSHEYRPEQYFGQIEDIETRGTDSSSGLYVTPVLDLPRLRIVPAARVSAFTGRDSQAFAVDPRVTARWTPHPRIALGLGAGLYSQPSMLYGRQATSQLLDAVGGSAYIPIPGGGAVVLPGVVRVLDARLDFDPSPIGVRRALQLSGNLHVELAETLGLDITGFFRGQRDGFPPRTQGTPFGGLIYGIETMLRKDLSRRLYGWIAYTWMRVHQGSLDGVVLSVRAPASLDQRHNLVALVGVKLPRRWELGARFRVVSGLPYTPVVGVIYTNDTFTPTTPLFGDTNSARMAVFHQLDLRVDKTWVLPRSIVGAYLDIQNIYNRQNPEGLLYDKLFAASTTVVGVPILPVFGVRVEY